MVKKKKRRAFPTTDSPQKTQSRGGFPDSKVIDADDPGFGIFGYFRNPGVRETIESVVIAVLLAFMFKTYEAEAFVIPTGSMAPSLQGEQGGRSGLAGRTARLEEGAATEHAWEPERHRRVPALDGTSSTRI